MSTESGQSLYSDPKKRRLRYMKAEEFDKKFDEGEDIS
jgi:hypothetical protein